MLSHWRVAVMVVLFSLPVLFLVALGAYYLWETELWFYAWWPLAGFLTLAYLLGWYWQRKGQLVRPVFTTPPMHWTDRDRQAWKLIEERANSVAAAGSTRLSEIPFYMQTAQEMALQLARFYYPKASDPVGALTIPEILAVVELAAHDLAEMVDRYLPGGHFLTINQWRKTRKAADWYQKASDVYWLVAAVFSPIKTGLRYAGSSIGLSRPFQMLQDNLFVWFGTAYIHRLGCYLIELNSGRLRVGAARYRELLAEGRPEKAGAEGAEPTESARRVTLAFLGQVKAGKSSLINALLGEQRAHTDVLPDTSEVTRYELHLKDMPTRLVLLDTVGYGRAGPRQDQLRHTERAARKSDLLLLLVHATQPARQADLQMLQELRAWFASQPRLKMPPVVAVLTHIDLLSPAMEWSPPYHWESPKRLKEEQIAEAVKEVRTQLGELVAAVVPVCTADGKIHGVYEWLLPSIVGLLDEAHAVGLLRCLHVETDQHRLRKTFHQLFSAGKELAKATLQGPLRN